MLYQQHTSYELNFLLNLKNCKRTAKFIFKTSQTHLKQIVGIKRASEISILTETEPFSFGIRGTYAEYMKLEKLPLE